MALAATRDVEDRSAGIGSFVGGEPEDALRDLLGLAGALQRRRRPDLLGASGLAARSVNLGLDHAGPDGIDANALRPDLFRQSERERIDRRLCRRVIDVLARRADPGGDRRDIDDRAARAAMLGRHALDGLARAK